MYVLRNTEALPCSHWWSGKGIRVTYSEFVFVVLSLQHAVRVRSIILSSVACLTTPFFSRHDFREKVTELKVYILIFSKNFRLKHISVY